MKDYYPAFLDLRGKKCLVIGGGEVATRKIKTLLDVRADVTVICPQYTRKLQELEEQHLLIIINEEYREEHLKNFFLVICASDKREVNQQVYMDCVSRNLLVNVVDDPERCNFFVPSVVSRGPLSIAISTEGKSPAFARRLREELERQYGSEYGEFLEVLGDLRALVKLKVKEPEKRNRLFSEIASRSFFNYYLMNSRRCK